MNRRHCGQTNARCNFVNRTGTADPHSALGHGAYHGGMPMRLTPILLAAALVLGTSAFAQTQSFGSSEPSSDISAAKKKKKKMKRMSGNSTGNMNTKGTGRGTTGTGGKGGSGNR